MEAAGDPGIPLPVPPLRRISLRRNSGYATGLTLLRFSLGVLTVPVLVRGLGVERYGSWAVLTAVLGMCALFQFGVDSAVSVQLASAQAEHDGEAVGHIAFSSLIIFLVLGGVVAVPFWVLRGLGASLLIESGPLRAEVAAALPLIGLAAWLQLFKRWWVSIESGHQRYDLQAQAEGLGVVTFSVGLILVALLGGRVQDLAAWVVIAFALTVAAHWFLCARAGLRPIEKRVFADRHTMRHLLSFGIRQWTSQLGGTFFGQVDRLIVNAVLGQAATGVYAAATAVATRINELSAAPVQVIIPAIASGHSARDFLRVDSILDRAQRLNLGIAYITSTAIIVISEPLARFLIPANPTETSSVLRILALVYALYSLNAVGYFAAQGIGCPSINARWVLSAGLIFIVAVGLAVHQGSLTAVAWANAAYSVTLGINFEVARRLKREISADVRRAILLLGSTSLSFFAGPALLQEPLGVDATRILSAALICCNAAAIFIYMAPALRRAPRP